MGDSPDLLLLEVGLVGLLSCSVRLWVIDFDPTWFGVGSSFCTELPHVSSFMTNLHIYLLVERKTQPAWRNWSPTF